MSEGVCKSVGLLLGAHLDGQLDTVKTIEVEDHLASCETCRERTALDRAFRGSLKKAVKISTPDDVRARMLAAMTGETARQEVKEEKPAASQIKKPGPTMLRHWRTMLPLASAAAVALAWGAASNQPVSSNAGSVSAGWGNDLLNDLVRTHSKAYPPEQRDPSEMSQYVGVPVRVPQFKNASFVGGRLVTLPGGEAAAMLQYVTTAKSAQQPQRVTIFVYDPRNVQISHVGLAPRAVGTSEANVGRANGYSVAVTQHRGVGYTIASDLDSDANADLVATVDKD